MTIGACLAMAMALVPTMTWAQATRGSLVGTVTDTSGAQVPGTTVTITEVGTNIVTTGVSNENGAYTFPNLKDGLYRVAAELTGFKKVVRENVQVDVNTTIRVDFRLEPGDLAETLTVTSESPALQTDRTDTGRVIQGEQIAAMPLGFGRNFQGMLATVPGASRPFKPHSEFFNSQDSLSSNVNGQSRLANNVMIEGIDNNQKTGLLSVIIPSAEALETVSVTTSNYDAEFGRAGGAVTNATIKSGTNQFRGSGFWFGDNQDTHAINAFVDRTLPKERQKPDTLYNQFGFTFGGPIMKNKLFFFGDYVRTNDDLGRVNRYVLPTAEQRAGNFSGSSVPIYDPLTGDLATGANREAFAGNVIPANRISPIAQKILASIPLPNLQAAPRAGQLPGHDDPHPPDRRLRRETQLPGVDEGSGVRPVQLHAPDSRGTRKLPERPRRPLPGWLRRHRCQQELQRRRQLGTDLDQFAGDGRPRRHDELPQRGAAVGDRPEHRRRFRHSRREPRHVHERHDRHQHRQWHLEPDRRVS